jgi:hypothetical protein
MSLADEAKSWYTAENGRNITHVSLRIVAPPPHIHSHRGRVGAFPGALCAGSDGSPSE